MSAIVSIHQPNYLPWLGYFHKMSYSGVFVFLDDVQYTPKTYTNRCHVNQGGRLTRLSIPVSLDRWDARIRDVQIDTDRFAAKHLETLRHAYGKCRAFPEVMELLTPHYRVGNTNLADFNIGLITALADYIGLPTRFVRMSETGVGTASNQLLIDITKSLDGDVFASGVGAEKYISGHECDYLDAGIALAYQNFVHPIYDQRTQPFVPGCSCIDLVFRAGRRAGEVIAEQSEADYVLWRAP